MPAERRPPPSPAVRPLRDALAPHLRWQNQRLTFLAQCLLALFQVRTVNLAELATALSPRAKVESNYKRLQRFFRGFTLEYPLIARLIVSLSSVGEGPWYLTLDRTTWQFGRCPINILMLGIAHQGLAIPLFWTLLPKAGNSSTAERIELLQRFIDTFGAERIAALLADREFIGREWFGWLQHHHIPFRIRLKANTQVPNAWNRPKPVSRLVSNLKPGQSVQLPGRRPVWGCWVFVVALRLENGSFLILATTETPDTALADYRRRWDIECLFGALKTRGFRFEDTHLTDPERIAKMVALLAIAFAWTFEAGLQRHQRQPIRLKKPFNDLSTRFFATDLTTSEP